MSAESIRIQGTVQGVGFRPHIWRLATELGIRGHVSNDHRGVLIHAWGDINLLNRFVAEIQSRKPPLATITAIQRSLLQEPAAEPADFRIAASRCGPSLSTLTAVSADAATCQHCLQEINDPHNRRYGYPFTNCTHCGPRFSIIRAVPYDRAHTSMAAFPLCEACAKEYEDPNDRRFHAQPNACPQCGPTLWLQESKASDCSCDTAPQNRHAIIEAASRIRQGQIIAIKGIGGFHLACDAGNPQVVRRLRQGKRRYRKALALMAKNVAMISEYCYVNETEAALLHSPAAPIVLLEKMPAATVASSAAALAPNVAAQQHYLGFMLPYTPLHHLLMQQLDCPLVMTSGNLSEEPQCIENEDAKQRLGTLADAFLLHDRDIVNRVDDSVVYVARASQDATQQLRFIRRARGYAPQPLALPAGFAAADGVLALGADLKNTFCMLQDGQAIVSPHMGDLENVSAQQDYRKNLALFAGLYAFKATHLCVDRHPGYQASRFGKALAQQQQLPCLEVQHHHAHIAAVMAENQLPVSTEKVLGIALDGLGYGDDGHFWGGEFLLADYTEYTPLARFKPVALLGGNIAMKEPWRNTLAQLLACPDWPALQRTFAETDILRYLRSKPLEILETMARRNLNSPPTSSAGRLFDAAAALMHLHRDEQFHEGEAAMALQATAQQIQPHQFAAANTPYPFQLITENGLTLIDWAAMWRALLEAEIDNSPHPIMAYRFHVTVCEAIALTIEQLSTHCAFSKIVMAGGVLQNRLLSELLADRLDTKGVDVYTSKFLPCNDAAIAFGQAVIGYATRVKHA